MAGVLSLRRLPLVLPVLLARGVEAAAVAAGPVLACAVAGRILARARIGAGRFDMDSLDRDLVERMAARPDDLAQRLAVIGEQLRGLGAAGLKSYLHAALRDAQLDDDAAEFDRTELDVQDFRRLGDAAGLPAADVGDILGAGREELRGGLPDRLGDLLQRREAQHRRQMRLLPDHGDGEGFVRAGVLHRWPGGGRLRIDRARRVRQVGQGDLLRRQRDARLGRCGQRGRLQGVGRAGGGPDEDTAQGGEAVPPRTGLAPGLGLQSTPANLILVSLALFMTFFVMAPTFDKAWQEGVLPLVENRISEGEAYAKITAPFRDFMLAQTRPQDLRLFADLAPESIRPQDPAQAVDLRVLIPSFMISELRRAFEIGFLIALPFLVIDMIVATIVMSMGMMMLPPTVISLPFKVIFFVLIDGWNLLIGGLVRSFS